MTAHYFPQYPPDDLESGHASVVMDVDYILKQEFPGFFWQERKSLVQKMGIEWQVNRCSAG